MLEQTRMCQLRRDCRDKHVMIQSLYKPISRYSDDSRVIDTTWLNVICVCSVQSRSWLVHLNWPFSMY